MKIHFPGSDNAGPGSEILWQALLSEGKETHLEKRKVTAQHLGLILFCIKFSLLSGPTLLDNP